MRFLIALVAAFCVCEARPPVDVGVSPHVIGGADATAGEWPWQLSLERLNGATWGHSCGAVLLTDRYALTTASCVDGATADILRVVAGLHDRTNTAGTQTSNVASFVMHADYNIGAGTNSDDICVLTLQAAIVVGGSVQLARLPAANNNTYAGLTCMMTGWGRTGITNQLANILQEAPIDVMTLVQCQNAFLNIAGIDIIASHICLQDPQNGIGACDGDAGGPVNCMDGGSYVVAGLASFVQQGPFGRCRQNVPSVYTRTSSFLNWITANTP